MYFGLPKVVSLLHIAQLTEVILTYIHCILVICQHIILIRLILCLDNYVTLYKFLIPSYVSLNFILICRYSLFLSRNTYRFNLFPAPNYLHLFGLNPLANENLQPHLV
jgi:hypothetical protein